MRRKEATGRKKERENGEGRQEFCAFEWPVREEKNERETVNKAKFIMKDLRTSDSKHYLVVSALWALDEIKEEMSQDYNHNLYKW